MNKIVLALLKKLGTTILINVLEASITELRKRDDNKIDDIHENAVLGIASFAKEK